MSKLTKIIIAILAIYGALLVWAHIGSFCPAYIDRMPRIYSEGLRGQWERLFKRGNYNWIHKMTFCAYPDEIVY